MDRSPLIAAMLAHAVPGLHVASAGTHAVVGAPAAALMVAVLAEAVLAGRGLSAGGHTARQLTAGMVRDARLVLTATRAHRTYVVQLDASAADSAFTVKELARLVAAAGLPPGAGLGAVLAGAVESLATSMGPVGAVSCHGHGTTPVASHGTTCVSCAGVAVAGHYRSLHVQRRGGIGWRFGRFV